jgi:hypothetical protein
MNLVAATRPSAVSPVIVGAEDASPQPTFPSESVTLTIRLSQVSIKIPDILIGILSGMATAHASIFAILNIYYISLSIIF